MVGHVVGLKVTLLRERAHALARHPDRLLVGLVVLGFAGSAWLTSGIDVVERLSSLHAGPDAGREQLQVLACLLVMAWLVAPLATTNRRDLTVRRFVLLPIDATRLTSGLFVAGLVSLGPLLTAVVVGVTARGYLDEAVGGVLVVLGALSLVLLAITVGRLVGFALDLVALLPRARTITMVATLPVLVVAFAGFELARAGFADPSLEAGVGSASTPPPAWLSWLPPSWAGSAMADAAEGSPGAALLALAGVVGVTAVLAVVLRLVVARTMVTDDRSGAGRGARADDAFAGFAARLPGDRTGAIAARTLRLFVRTPGRLTGYAFYVGIFGLVLSVLIAVNLPPADAPLAVVVITFALGMRRANEYGADANGWWMDVVSPGPRRGDVLGRDLGGLLVDGPLLVAVTAVFTVVWRAWAMFLPALGLAATGWLIGATVTHVVSVRLATAPPTATDTRRAGSGSTSGGYLQAVATELGFVVLMLPVVVAAVVPLVLDEVWLAVTVPLALAYAVGLWLVTLRRSAHWLDHHEARLLQQLTAG